MVTDRYLRCELCSRIIRGATITWIFEHYGFKNLKVCKECGMSVAEQIVSILRTKRELIVFKPKND